jgi:hypothetical protein
VKLDAIILPCPWLFIFIVVPIKLVSISTLDIELIGIDIESDAKSSLPKSEKSILNFCFDLPIFLVLNLWGIFLEYIFQVRQLIFFFLFYQVY